MKYIPVILAGIVAVVVLVMLIADLDVARRRRQQDDLVRTCVEELHGRVILEPLYGHWIVKECRP